MPVLPKALVSPLFSVDDRQRYGAKAFRLAEMHRLGYPVPEGIVIGGDMFSWVLQDPAIQQLVRSRVDPLGAE